MLVVTTLLCLTLLVSWLVKGFLLVPIAGLATLGSPGVWLGGGLLLLLAWCYSDS
jgi:hypothetical protein